MKKILLLLFMLPTLLWAQDDAKYLAGAVPVEDGYVTFRQTFKAPSLSQKDIYQSMLLWATQKFQKNEQFPQNQLITQDEAAGSCRRGIPHVLFQLPVTRPHAHLLPMPRQMLARRMYGRTEPHPLLV